MEKILLKFSNMAPVDKPLKTFKEKLQELAHLKMALSVMHWDQEVYMPPEGSAPRALALSYIAGELHEKFLSTQFKKILAELNEARSMGHLREKDAAVIREVSREFEREEKFPLKFVKELIQTTSEAHHVWIEARKKNDFKIFLPHLEKIIELKREEANLVGFKSSPYDALLDTYEPYATTEDIGIALEDMKNFLVPFIQKIKPSLMDMKPEILAGDFDIDKQDKFGKMVAEKIGFNFKAGRLDVSAHPFTIGHHPQDVRITTRYDRHNLFTSLGSIIHETGHALYEQGQLVENFGTPLGESVSLGIHESQSRVWENLVGKSRPFWQYFYPLLKIEFTPHFDSIRLEDFYRAINCVRPSLIRTESDEVTYNLHIILRFEIEKALIEGDMAAEDLPQIWNEKTKSLLGIDVPSDSMGVLQDVHWSGGMFGYFPTYTLGNLYSAQFYAAAKRDILSLEEEIAAGEFGHFRNWLRGKIHIHGKLYTASELCMRATGEKLNGKYFIDYIKNKYGDIYGIKA